MLLLFRRAGSAENLKARNIIYPLFIMPTVTVSVPKSKTKRPRRRNAKPAKSKTARRRRSKARRRFVSASLSPMAAYRRLLLDPCSAPVACPPFSDSQGYCLRLQASYTLHGGSAAANNGYLTWFPEFVNQSTYASLFIFENSSTSVAPVNTLANPYGSSRTTSASALDSPAWAYCSNQPNGVFRVVAACARVMYVGSDLNRSGMFAASNNVSAKQVFGGLFGNGNFPTVDNLFSAMPNHRRLQSSMEVIWKPNQVSSLRFRSACGSTFTNPSSDYLVFPGIPTTSTTVASPQFDEDTRAITIAWKGLNSTVTSDVVVEFYQVIEMIPGINWSAQIPSIKGAKDAGSIIGAVTSSMDGQDIKLDGVWDAFVRYAYDLPKALAYGTAHGFGDSVMRNFLANKAVTSGNVPALEHLVGYA